MGICSAGDAGGDGSIERSYLKQHVLRTPTHDGLASRVPLKNRLPCPGVWPCTPTRMTGLTLMGMLLWVVVVVVMDVVMVIVEAVVVVAMRVGNRKFPR